MILGRACLPLKEYRSCRGDGGLRNGLQLRALVGESMFGTGMSVCGACIFGSCISVQVSARFGSSVSVFESGRIGAKLSLRSLVLEDDITHFSL
jgi:hypothetical protein